MSSLFKAASAMARRGLFVFPLTPRGKLPLISTERGGKGLLDATTDQDQIAAWWTQAPDANIGLNAGASGLAVLDVDPRHEGDRTLARLVGERGAIPWTVSTLTGSGGSHHLFKLPAGVTITSRPLKHLGPGLDCKSNGGYIVAPPSIHPNGEPYQWINDGSKLAELAGWLLDEMRAASEASSEPSQPPNLGHYRRVVPRLERALAYVDKMPIAVSGAGGHEALWRVACVLVHKFGLPDEAAIESLRYYSARCEPPWSEKELDHKLKQARRNARQYAHGSALA